MVIKSYIDIVLWLGERVSALCRITSFATSNLPCLNHNQPKPFAYDHGYIIYPPVQHEKYHASSLLAILSFSFEYYLVHRQVWYRCVTGIFGTSVQRLGYRSLSSLADRPVGVTDCESVTKLGTLPRLRGDLKAVPNVLE